MSVSRGESGEHPGLVHPRPDRADQAFRAEPLERGIGLLERVPVVVVGVVQEHDVDALEAEADQALLEGAQDAVGTEVEHPPERRGDREAFVVGPPRRVDRLEEASGLGREHELVTGASLQGVAETAFGQPEAVVRCRVKGADPEVPSRVDGRASVLVGDLAEEVAELRPAE